MKKSLSKLVNDDERLIECDVAADENIEKAFTEVQRRFGKIDGIVAAIMAYGVFLRPEVQELFNDDNYEVRVL